MSEEGEKARSPIVGVVMGSASDWPTMVEAVMILEQFGVSVERRVVSAHRTPGDLAEYGRTAHERGVRVIIAGAGGAAHLPGMLAAYSPLPVIGVPVLSRSLGGLDSLLSIVQMPGGVPVATVAIGGGKNAGILALQILGLGDAGLQARIMAFKGELADMARAQSAQLDLPTS